MKTWKILITALLVWLGIGFVIALRVYSQNKAAFAGGFAEVFVSSLPSWLLWAIATPLIFWTVSKFPFKKDKWPTSLLIHACLSLIFVLIYTIAFIAIDNISKGKSPSTEQLMASFKENIVSHWHFILILYGLVVICAWLGNLFFSTDAKKGKSAKSFDNAIIIKTNYGFVLVEIEKFQYVKGGGRKIMFHTGRTRHMNRQRVIQEKGKLVNEEKYRPDRRIVIDLAKIRRAEQINPDKFIFHIGYSHEIILNAELYQKLGGWLPKPKLNF